MACLLPALTPTLHTLARYRVTPSLGGNLFIIASAMNADLC